MKICIFGASSDHLAARFYEDAEALGRLLAGKGHTLVFGGGSGGLMGACAKGAIQNGGRSIGVSPRMFQEAGFLLDGCGELLLTDTMASRKEKMIELSDAFIVLPGGIGTMDEFFELLTLRQLGLVDAPLVLLNTGGFYGGLIAFLEQMAEQGFMSRACLELLQIAETPEEALHLAETPTALQGSVRRLEDYNRVSTPS